MRLFNFYFDRRFQAAIIVLACSAHLLELKSSKFIIFSYLGAYLFIFSARKRLLQVLTQDQISRFHGLAVGFSLFFAIATTSASIKVFELHKNSSPAMTSSFWILLLLPTLVVILFLADTKNLATMMLKAQRTRKSKAQTRLRVAGPAASDIANAFGHPPAFPNLSASAHDNGIIVEHGALSLVFFPASIPNAEWLAAAPYVWDVEVRNSLVPLSTGHLAASVRNAFITQRHAVDFDALERYKAYARVFDHTAAAMTAATVSLVIEMGYGLIGLF